MLVSSDDDRLIPVAISELDARLRLERPAFVTTTWVDRGGGTTRGDRPRAIRPSEFIDAAKHAPGLVYHVPTVKRALPLLARFVDDGEPAAFVYPQAVMLAILLACRADCRWSDLTPVEEGLQLPSGMVLPSGSTYRSFDAQMEIRRSFFRILDQLEGSAALRRANARKLLIQVRHSLPQELHGELEAAYERLIIERRRKRWYRNVQTAVLRAILGPLRAVTRSRRPRVR